MSLICCADAPWSHLEYHMVLLARNYRAGNCINATRTASVPAPTQDGAMALILGLLGAGLGTTYAVQTRRILQYDGVNRWCACLGTHPELERKPYTSALLQEFLLPISLSSLSVVIYATCQGFGICYHYAVATANRSVFSKNEDVRLVDQKR